MTTADDTLDQALDAELEALIPADPGSIAPDAEDRPDDTFEPDPTFKERPDSGLGLLHRIRARDRAVQAATLALNRAAEIHYTEDTAAQIAAQGGVRRRWDGIRLHRNARLGQFPTFADCSSFATWCLWNGLHLAFDLGDNVNGGRWTGGYTGSMLDHGLVVDDADHLQRGDCVLYGVPGTVGKHTAMFVGRKSDGTLMVISHGQESGPHFINYDYRSDIMGFRRYI
jgi:hypothetical protein